MNVVLRARRVGASGRVLHDDGADAGQGRLVVITFMMSFGSSGSRRSGRVGAAIALAGALLVLPGAATAARDCKVSNARTRTPHASLQAAVDAAVAGDRLRVSGVCAGSTVVDRDLVIRGVRTATSGRPILDGVDAGRVLRITVGVVVDLKDLVIRRGDATGDTGGGILNRGQLTLTDVVVVKNRADTGGGIYSTGQLTLNGATSIRQNQAIDTDGGGITVEGGRLTVNDASAVHGNVAGRGGGGIYGVNARMTLDGSSSVHDNEAVTGGGGIYADFYSTLVLNGSSTVHDNAAAGSGGGVFDNSSLTMNDASSIVDNDAGERGGGVFVGCNAEATGVDPGGNVKGNHPSNRAVEMGCS